MNTKPVVVSLFAAIIAATAVTASAERYPGNHATGFAANELRGAFFVEWPAQP